MFQTFSGEEPQVFDHAILPKYGQAAIPKLNVRSDNQFPMSIRITVTQTRDAVPDY
jgi:hypothetical protein